MTYFDRLRSDHRHWRRKVKDGHGISRDYPWRMYLRMENYMTRAQYNRAKGTNHSDTVQA